MGVLPETVLTVLRAEVHTLRGCFSEVAPEVPDGLIPRLVRARDERYAPIVPILTEVFRVLRVFAFGIFRIAGRLRLVIFLNTYSNRAKTPRSAPLTAQHLLDHG